MIIHREIGPSYHYKPIVQEVNYSPLMVESKKETFMKEERWPEVIPAEVPPPVFLRRWATTSVSWFSCFSLASLREHLGDSLYRGF
jgi:hypothetical protein